MARRFEDLEVWQKARMFCKDVHEVMKESSFSKDYALCNQLNRSSGSVMDNIAEGYERNNNKELIQYLYIAKGSAGEVRSQLYRAFDRNYILKVEFEKLLIDIENISKQLNNFIEYVKNTDMKGAKHVYSIEQKTKSLGSSAD